MMNHMNTETKTLLVIGGGASGLAAAVAAGRAARRQRARVNVIVLEMDDRVGRTVLATGNGRCNFSNAFPDASVYRNAAFVGETLAALDERWCHAGAKRDALQSGTGVDVARDGDVPFQALQRDDADSSAWQRDGLSSRALQRDNPVLAFFADAGLVWREEGEGRLYPLTNKATTVLDVLRAAARDAGVVERCEAAVTELVMSRESGGRFHARLADGAIVHGDAVVIACGSHRSEPLLPPAFSHAPQQPVLGPLRVEESFVKQLDNIRVRAAVSVVGPEGTTKACECGEVLFRSYGVSGIAVFNVSRVAEPGDAICIDVLPFLAADEREPFLRARFERLAHCGEKLSNDDFLRGVVLPAVGRAVLKQARLKPDAPLRVEDAPALAAALSGLSFTIAGIGDARQCQVRRGGYDVAAFDPRTMRAHAQPRLYVVGEALDIDAPCGGYNLHWAWASGMLAGMSAVEELAR